MQCLPRLRLSPSTLVNVMDACFHTGLRVEVGRAWRERNRLPPVGNEYGPLTDLPDWSYADGRMAPLGSKQRRRKAVHAELTNNIIQMLSEVDSAVNRHQEMQHDLKIKKRNVSKERLKPRQ